MPTAVHISGSCLFIGMLALCLSHARDGVVPKMRAGNRGLLKTVRGGPFFGSLDVGIEVVGLCNVLKDAKQAA
jgi:hypothetical protein